MMMTIVMMMMTEAIAAVLRETETTLFLLNNNYHCYYDINMGSLLLVYIYCQRIISYLPNDIRQVFDKNVCVCVCVFYSPRCKKGRSETRLLVFNLTEHLFEIVAYINV